MDLFDNVDLRAVHVVLCLGGVLLSTHLMQLVWQNPEEGGMALRWARRLNLALIAFAMLWSLSVAMERGWQPWPPGVLLIFGVDMMMLLRILVVHRMLARGARVRPPYPVVVGVAPKRKTG